MIELSKCPTCAAEDRVTIAGKEFCMRCGTPSEDNAMIAASSSDQPAGQGMPSSVSKFAQSPPATQTQDDQQSDGSSQVTNQVSDQAANTSGSMPATTDSATQQQNSVVQQVNAQIQNDSDESMTQQANASIQQSANPISTNTGAIQTTSPSDTAIKENSTDSQQEIQNLDRKIEELSSQTPKEDQTNTTAEATNPIQQAVPTLPPTETDSTASPSENSSIPVNVSSAPEEMKAPSFDPSAQSNANIASKPPTVSNSIDTIFVQAQPSNTMPGSAGLMTLDKNEPAVFSDEELHELSNTQIEPINMPNQAAGSIAMNSSIPAVANNAMNSSSSDQTLSQALPKDTMYDNRQAVASNPTLNANNSTITNQQDTINTAPPKSPVAKKVLKPAGVAMSIAIIFASGVYIWKMNYPNLAFKIASSKAGINATMPGYIPEGYSLKDSIQTTPGSVSYNLVKGDGKIAVSQSKTDWDSQALAENYVSPKAENYLAIQAQGLTIYMMGNNQASWVNKGTWYRIESPNQTLNRDQIIKMATSL